MRLPLRIACLGLALLLSACALGRHEPQPVLYDLGPLSAASAPAVARPSQVAVTAPPWLSGSGIAYRLAYQDAFRREVYRDSRWAAPPAALLAERLRQRAAVGTAAADSKPLVLRLELEEFGQVFDTPTQSRVLLRARAWRGEDAAAQLRVFEVARPAATADAAGAVRAFSLASDELIDQLLAWAAGA